MGEKLHIIHCIDTEGPLEETLDATFERLYQKWNINIDQSRKNLKKLQKMEIDLDGIEKEVSDFIAPKRLAYLESWEKIEEMILDITSKEFREKYIDSYGNPYLFSWFIIDVVGYKDNPRRKAVGYHKIWDMYQNFLKNSPYGDALGWHFHTVPVGNHALNYNTCWTNNDYHEKVISRKILERSIFPSIFRSGGTIERNDLSFWLEQFIPFDFSCSSIETNESDMLYDWRHSPKKWGSYHPDFYDYRKVGNMRRRIFRCIDIDTIHCALDVDEIRKSFKQVRDGESTILAMSGHDRRDLRPEIENAYHMITKVSKEFPEVKWKFNNALDAAREVHSLEVNNQLKFNIERDEDIITIKSSQELFGPIPFLAIEEYNEVFFRDNPIIESPTSWKYKLLRPNRTKRLGVGASDFAGNIATEKIQIT